MGAEYVKLSSPEKFFAEKNLLLAHLEILTEMKRLRTYSQLRQEETKLKLILKERVNDVLNQLRELEKGLPKSSIKITDVKKEKIEIQVSEDPVDMSLEQEIDYIKKKLTALQ